jgi:hypothetical protein
MVAAMRQLAKGSYALHGVTLRSGLRRKQDREIPDSINFSSIDGARLAIEIVQPEEADPALIATLHDMLTSAKAGISGFNQRAQKY